MTRGLKLFAFWGMAVAALLVCAKLAYPALFAAERPAEHYNYVIGVSQPNLSDPWLIAMNEEVREEVNKHPDMQVIFSDAAQSSAQQRQDVEKLVSYGIDLLIISLDDPLALTETIKHVYAKIPVIVLGRGVTGYDYTLYIGTDNEMIGRKAGEYAEELLGGRPGRVIELQGVRESPTAEERSNGFSSALEGTKLSIIQRFNADWQRDKAEDVLATWFARGGDEADVIFAHNEAMAIGAYQAVKRHGIPGVSIIAIDGVNLADGSRRLVADDMLTAAFTSPTGGKEAIRYAIDILNKEKGIPKKIILRSEKVTAADKAGVGTAARAGTPMKPNDGRPIRLGFAQVGTESGWRIANTNSVVSAARNEGIELLYENAEQSQERQIEMIRSFIRRKVDVIAFSPKTESGWDEVLGEARAAGIPVILSDREVKAADDTLWTAYMGSDFRDEGRRAANWLVQEVSGDRGYNVVELQGTSGSAPAIGRKRGFDEVLSGDRRFHRLASYEGDFTKAKGRALMEQALREHGREIGIVYAHNDDMALGAIEAIEAYGLRPGKEIWIISVDATRAALKALSIGKLNLVVECNPLLGPQLMKAVKDLAAGKELPMKIVTAEGMFTPQSAKVELGNREF
ncbi:substrate-binding domain-containing protein [Paenibacillus aurantiacus]|uniref:Substrate-binding domain-containing protein n=1 Tax=Paenibacillus aurantiacus TaxID=1936118 RepID=A0ABV5KQE5_9BACL